MLNRILAVTALGLAVGLAACDQAGQEQAETPKDKGTQTEQRTPSAPPAEPSAPPSSAPSAPSGSSSSPGGTTGGSSGNQ
jgi:hypothetical protein